MRQATHKVLREGKPRQEDLTKGAPTEPEAFLRWSSQRRREEGKFELSRGRVVCNMINASSLHSRVVRNLVVELGRLLDPDRFDIAIADFAVQTPYGIRSPDIVVEPARARRALSTATPIFIVEVLSKSTKDVDFTEKLEEYEAIETLQSYLVCDQDEPHAWVWGRHDDGSWPLSATELVGRGGSVCVEGLGVELAMAAIFRGIPDAPAGG